MRNHGITCLWHGRQITVKVLKPFFTQKRESRQCKETRQTDERLSYWTNITVDNVIAFGRAFHRFDDWTSYNACLCRRQRRHADPYWCSVFPCFTAVLNLYLCYHNQNKEWWYSPFSNCSYQTSKQHKDATEARTLRDYNDTLHLIDYLSQRDPFSRIMRYAALRQVSLLMRRLMSISARKWETRCYVLWLAKMRTTTHFVRKTKQLPLRARRLWG